MGLIGHRRAGREPPVADWWLMGWCGDGGRIPGFLLLRWGHGQPALVCCGRRWELHLT